MTSHATRTNEESINIVQQSINKTKRDSRSDDNTKVGVCLGDLMGVMTELAYRGRQMEINRNRLDYVELVKQDKFGTVCGKEDTGNCFQVCISTVTGIPLAKVPHFYSLFDENDIDRANAMIANWLGGKGFHMAHYPYEVVKEGLASGWFYAGSEKEKIVVIATGKSPRGDWNHAVVGVLDKDAPHGWTMIHDPHPSGAGLETTGGIEVVSKTMRIGA